MDEESRQETVLREHYACFRKGKAGSMICRETSAEARPLQADAIALKSEGIALLVGPRGRSKTEGGQEF